MQFDQYQRLSERTANSSLERKDAIINAVMGLTGEAGEVMDHMKKVLYHGHDLQVPLVIEELGDVIYYAFWLASILGIDMNDVALENVAKLRKRYPDGFNSANSINRTKERVLGSITESPE